MNIKLHLIPAFLIILLCACTPARHEGPSASFVSAMAQGADRQQPEPAVQPAAQTVNTSTSSASAAAAAVSTGAASAPQICEGTDTVTDDSSEDDLRDMEDEDDAVDIFVSSVTAPPPPVNLGGDGTLTITRRNTGETLTAAYRNADGTYNQEELAKINQIMRCSFTGEQVPMAVKLIELLDAVEDHFGKRGLILLSGYRTPEYNRTIRGASKNSLHMLGWAADIRIPSCGTANVKKFGLQMAVGGVGYYPSMGFTHLDVGRVRYWEVKRYKRKRRRHKTRHYVSSSRHAGKTGKKQAKKSPGSAKKATFKPERASAPAAHPAVKNSQKINPFQQHQKNPHHLKNQTRKRQSAIQKQKSRLNSRVSQSHLRNSAKTL